MGIIRSYNDVNTQENFSECAISNLMMSIMVSKTEYLYYLPSQGEEHPEQ